MKWKILYLSILFLSALPYLPLPFIPPQGICWIRDSYLFLPKICFLFAIFFLIKGYHKRFLLAILPFIVCTTFLPDLLRVGVHHSIILLNSGRNIKEVHNYFPSMRMYINKKHTTFNWNLGNWDNYEELVFDPHHLKNDQYADLEIIEIINQDWYVRKAMMKSEIR